MRMLVLRDGISLTTLLLCIYSGLFVSIECVALRKSVVYKRVKASAKLLSTGISKGLTRYSYGSAIHSSPNQYIWCAISFIE
ncbi:hypothetical protein THOG05_80106 [Vibrio rotiferianus]|nr:hypothetical protein THOG05_80106 [Vibrio rotiferianus]